MEGAQREEGLEMMRMRMTATAAVAMEAVKMMARMGMGMHPVMKAAGEGKL